MISGVVLVRNEASNIVDCIQSIRPHVTEIILIDMESEDATIELAQPLVDKILNHKLVSNFDCARNLAIPEAANQWLWFVDADERLSLAIGEVINNLVREKGNDFEAINIPFKTHFCGKWMEHSGWWPGYTMPRVLKKGHFRFSERLHGGVECSGREIRIAADPNLGIDHFSYLSIEHYIEKFNRYTSTEAAQLSDSNQSVDWRNGIAHMVHDLWMYYERNHGDLDGRHGWILAWLSGQYRWLSHAKLLDADPDSAETPDELIPDSLDAVMELMAEELEGLRGSNPHLPLGVVFHSPIWDLSGYADEGRCIAKALSSGDRPVIIEENRWNDSICDVKKADQALFRALQNGKRSKSNITITNCIPTLAVPDKSAALNVIRTTFETDRIPQYWLPHLEHFDEIWVISKHNERSFIRSGVAPEKIRVVPSFIDTQVYRPDGEKIELPAPLKERFVFLAVFDWQLRKGWDILLKAYCSAFEDNGKVGLLLKISRSNGIPLETIITQARNVLSQLSPSAANRTDIAFQDDEYSTAEMANLYRSVDAFVLPSRGEGWGRPYMEAMASGLPTIGTGESGNIDFMDADNSVLVPASLVDVPTDAVDEISVYEGHEWFEPDLTSLTDAMQAVFYDSELRDRLSACAIEHIQTNHDLTAGTKYFQNAIDGAEQRFKRPRLEQPSRKQIKIAWEGEFFAGHSFSNINEQLTSQFLDDDRFGLKLDRKIHNPTYDSQHPSVGLFESYFHREFADGADVVVRHAFPPNWSKPSSGRWVHIQPWEFGNLPQDWIVPLQNDVDEIWVPTNYVKKVYVDSGIPQEKVFVIPWGVDPDVFSMDVPQRILPTKKSFRFVFVGGTIHRKGFDRVLKAYLEEFREAEDVCLVVKDLGTDTFYRYGNLSEETITARDDRSKPEIVYYNDSWSAGQLASLYAACNCLVMPYRGEGFGLPILEAMACGIPAIVPKGGASDDFVSESNGLLLDGQLTETVHDWELVGPALELEIDVADLRRKMRFAFENQRELEELGRNAGQFVRENFTWGATKEKMCERISEILDKDEQDYSSSASGKPTKSVVTACIRTHNNETTLANCLSRLVPFVDEILIVDSGSTDRTFKIAQEYRARVVLSDNGTIPPEVLDSNVSTDWRFWISIDELVDENDACQIIPFLESQPVLASEVVMQVDSISINANGKNRTELRHFRCNS